MNIFFDCQDDNIDWWYARVYPGSCSQMDYASQLVLPWLKFQAEALGASKWYFIRYVDFWGHHLRLRIQTNPSGVDCLVSKHKELLFMIKECKESHSYERLLPGAEFYSTKSIPEVKISIFTPELEKYGGICGNEIALHLFTQSTEWYVENCIYNFPQKTVRSKLALQYLSRLVSTALSDSEQQQFWHMHRIQWGWQLTRLFQSRNELNERCRIAFRELSEISLSPNLDDEISSLASNVIESATAASMCSNSVSRIQYLLEFLHMDMNRWGFMPSEECLLGILAEKSI